MENILLFIGIYCGGFTNLSRTGIKQQCMTKVLECYSKDSTTILNNKLEMQKLTKCLPQND